jgi:hypothetical protein
VRPGWSLVGRRLDARGQPFGVVFNFVSDPAWCLEPELILTFGGGGVPLLGDVDGDGRDEICLARDGRLRCDTNHDGGGAELDVPFDPAEGEPLLGNVDGY